MRNWDDGFNKIEFYDLGRYNKHSDLGGLPSGIVSMMELYLNPLPSFRSLIDIGAHVMQDRLKFSSERALCRNRLGDAWEHRHILTGLIPNGCMRDSRMVRELPTLSWMVSNCHILWMELLSEIIYHPALIENAFTWRNSATTEDQMWDLDGSILSKIVPILESKIHKHRVSVRDHNNPLEPRYGDKEHPFVEEMSWRAPNLWESLEPWRQGLRTQLVIMEGATAPFHNMFENLQRAVLKFQIGLALAKINLTKRHFAQTFS
ncbi:MAG: hypothetical protein GY820_00200 [Gammaproteobacteria bacterium]|nr:hypothetical protein [Gammaproteobacteria bacterium]